MDVPVVLAVHCFPILFPRPRIGQPRLLVGGVGGAALAGALIVCKGVSVDACDLFGLCRVGVVESLKKMNVLECVGSAHFFFAVIDTFFTLFLMLYVFLFLLYLILLIRPGLSAQRADRFFLAPMFYAMDVVGVPTRARHDRTVIPWALALRAEVV